MPVQESTDQQVHARRAHQEICENLLYDPQGRAHPRCRAPGIGCEAGLGLAPIGRMSRTERSIRHCRATPGRRFRFRRDRWFWVAMRTGSWCVVRGVAQGHPATHAAAYRDRGPAPRPLGGDTGARQRIFPRVAPLRCRPPGCRAPAPRLAGSASSWCRCRP